MQKRLLVCDLDNTLYDWVAYFVPSFYSMVDQFVRDTGCDRERLLDEFRSVHREAHDSELPFALLETRTAKQMFDQLSSSDAWAIVDAAFHAFNSARKRYLKLYPRVHATLKALYEGDVRLVAHTESNLYGMVDRVNRLGLTSFFAKIYCRQRAVSTHPFPDRAKIWLDHFPMEKVGELSQHQAKPSREVLLEICRTEGIAPDQAAYVGDSVARDVLMAKRSGVFSIWAAYGARHDPAQYEALVRVSHWTEEDIANEKHLREAAKHVAPDYVADEGFAQVLNALELVDSSVSAASGV